MLLVVLPLVVKADAACSRLLSLVVEADALASDLGVEHKCGVAYNRT